MLRFLHISPIVISLIWLAIGIVQANEIKTHKELKSMTPTEQRVEFQKRLPVAKQGHAATQFQIGLSYGHGLGVAKDRKKAIFWLRKSAGNSYPQAQIAIGTMYLIGSPETPQSSKKALDYFRRAEEQGSAYAQFMLGYMYQTGAGIKRDDVKAAKWFGKAARNGSAAAQFQIAVVLGNGRGVELSREKSLIWFKIASDAGVKDAETAWRMFEKKLPKSVISEATDKARKCVETNYKICE